MVATNIDAKTLGQRLLKARKVRGLTQAQAAQQLGCSRPTLIAIEKGTRHASAREIARLAEIYDSSVHQLVRSGSDAEPIRPHLRAPGLDDAAHEQALDEAVAVLQGFADDYRHLQEMAGGLWSPELPPEVMLRTGVPLRELADVTAVRERNRLHLGDGPALDLRSAVEAAGVHVFYWPIPSLIAGLYAFVPDVGYCILINRNHPPQRRRWTLAHEYGHFLCDRHTPGVDYMDQPSHKPLNERFADAFAAPLLMPGTGMRREFLTITSSTGDFQTADLCRLANSFYVSAQAMCYRLEDMGLLSKGTWDALQERGFKPAKARDALKLKYPEMGQEAAWPERYKYLAVKAISQENISEGQFAEFLRTDRVSAREILLEAMRGWDVDELGGESLVDIPPGRSLLNTA